MARVGTQRFEKVTITGFADNLAGPRQMLDRYADCRTVELGGGERQVRIAVQILYVPFVEKRVFCQLSGIETNPDDPRIGNFRRQMADPTRHQIENGAAGRQDLTIEIGDRGDRGRIDLLGARQFGTCERVGSIRQCVVSMLCRPVGWGAVVLIGVSLK